MKKIILIIATVLIATTSFAQWSLTGNAGTTTSNFIGTTDFVDFKIRTNNSTRMTVSSNGYVGIGITPETISRLYSTFTVGTTIVYDQVYTATRGRVYNSGVRANGYLGVGLFATASVNGFPTTLNYMGVLGIKEDASDNGAGVVGWNKSDASTGNNYGVYGLANGAVAIGGTTDKNIGVYGRAAGNVTNIGIYGYGNGSSDYAGYFTGRGYFSDKVGIGVETPSSMLTVDAPTSTSIMSLRSNGTTKMFLNDNGYLGLGTTVQTSVIEVNAPVGVSPLKLSINGSTKFLVNTIGKVGIGTTSPTARLHVKTTTEANCGTFANTQSVASSILGIYATAQNFGGASFGVSAVAFGSTENYALVGKSITDGNLNYGVYGEAATTSNGFAFGVYGKATGGSTNNPVYGIYGTATGSSNFWAGYFEGTTYAASLRVGTTNAASGYIANIGGKLICEEVKVALEANWPDYVFANDYQLMPLEELKNHLDKNNHLPGLPSAKEVEDNGGFHVGEMQQKLLEKVEELTLYVIKLNEDNKDLRKQLELLKK